MARLKRVVLIGDHHQLPPVVKNMAFQKFSHLDQSLFTRFVRLGTPYIQLNAQVRVLSLPRPCSSAPARLHTQTISILLFLSLAFHFRVFIWYDCKFHHLG